MTAARRRLARAIGVEPGEGTAFAWAAATAFLVGWADVSLANVADTFFLKRIGVRYLPWVFLTNSLLLVATTFATSRLAAGRAPGPLLARAFFGLAALLLPLWGLVLANVRSAFVLLTFASKQVVSVAAVVYWNALGDLFDGRQAKRLFAPIIAGGTLGEILGSFASGPLGKALGIAHLLLVGALVLTLAGVLASRLHALAPSRFAAPSRRAEPRPDLVALAVPLWREGRLFRVLVFTTLLCGALAPMLYFQFSYVADLATQGRNGEERLLQLYAALRGSINLGVLGLQLAGTARIFQRVGVPLAATLAPVVYLLGFLGVSVRLDLPAAIGAVAGASFQDHALYEPAERVLSTLHPERLRAAAAAWIAGPVRRGGGALGNAIVLVALALGTPASVGWVGVPIAALWVVLQARLWRMYPSLLLDASRVRRGAARESAAFAELVDPGTLRVLETTLATGDAERVRAACELVAEAPPERAAVTLARAAGQAAPLQRSLVLEALEAIAERVEDPAGESAAAARALGALLDDPGAKLPDADRVRAVRALARLAPERSPEVDAGRLLARFAHDPAPCVRLAARAALLGPTPTGDEEDARDALLAEAFGANDSGLRAVALSELRAALLAGEPGSPRFTARVERLAALLADRRTRPAAAAALADVATRHGAALAAFGAPLLECARDDDPRLRASALRFVGAARLSGQAPLLVERLGSADAVEAEAADAALRRLGASAVDALLAAVHSGGWRERDAALAILREVPVDPDALRAALAREIDAARHALAWRRALARELARPVHPLALQRLAERADEALHGALLVLAALAKEERIAELARLLARTQSGRARALLLEALEALLPPAEARRVLPLLEDVTSAPSPSARSDALGARLPPFEAALEAALASDDAMTRELLLAARSDLEDARRDASPTPELPMPSRLEIVLQLRGLDLFSRLTTRQLGDLAGALKAERHRAGEAIVREGEFGDSMYLVESGEVEISRAGRSVARAGAGEVFGEMALFDGETRSATVTAAADTVLLRLERADLFALLEEQPAMAIAICQTLSRKMRELIRSRSS